MSMQPADVIRRWFDEVWNQGREESIDRLLGPHVVAHGLPGGAVRGADGFRQVFHTFRGALPDIRIDVERTIAEGDFVAAYCRVTGTHKGDTLGFAATGRQVEFTGVTIAKIVDGQLVEGWNCFDFLTMYQQLGAVPAAPGT